MSRNAGRRPLLVAPAVLFAAGACMASRSDIRVLQQDLAVMRAERATADSMQTLKLDSIARRLGLAGDSLRLLSSRVTKLSGDVRGELYSLGQQLIAIQELTGQSQRRIQEMRASLEARQQQQGAAVPVAPATPAGTPPTAGADTTTVTRAPAPPGPNQLFEIALAQLRRGSTRAARIGFTDLLTQYPSADVAGEAQYYVAETFRQEGAVVSADSAYRIVVARYPQSPRAATALFKHAQYLESVGKTADARAAYQRLVRDYPRSDEAVLARDRLRADR